MGRGYVAEQIAKQSAKSLLPNLARARLARLNAEAEAQQANLPKPGGYIDRNSVLTEYADKPVEFIRELLGVELTSQQIPIAECIRDHDKVAVKSGQKTGKTMLDVCLAVWWCCTRRRGKVIVTSSSFEQVKDPIWSELTNLWQRLQDRGLDLFPEPALDPRTGVRWRDGRSIRGLSTKKKERAAGKSGAEQLIILDETSGIDAAICEAFEGNTLGGGKLLCTTNPTEVSGFLFDCFNSKRAFWHCFTLSARETPNYVNDNDLIPGLARRRDVDQLIKAYGEGSPFVDVRVDGNFPKTSSNAVITLGQVEIALKRWSLLPEEIAGGNTLDLGVDVARFGDDDSAITGRRGLRLYSSEWFKAEKDIDAVVHGYDSHEVAGVVLRCMRALRRPGNERVRIKLDAAGGYGTAVADVLRHLRNEGKTEGLDEFVDIIEINVSEVSTDPEKYPRLRSEVWFGGRDFFKAGGVMYGDPQLESEFIAPIYKVTPKGQLEVEKKEDTKKRLGRSPDRADSALLAIYDTGLGIREVKLPPAPQGRWGGAGRGFG
jgi:phage terminase large subunit